MLVTLNKGYKFKYNNKDKGEIENMNDLYKYPMAMTQQFKHCGNPFRIDTYKGCDFGCRYCFANNRGGGLKQGNMIADFSIIEKFFKKAFDSDKEFKDLTIELLRHRVPLHLGGMADPFQNREWKYEITYKLLELSKKYNYPIIMSTKVANLPNKYWDVLDPKIHGFQISLFSMNEELVRKFETNTPSPQERLNFMKKLHDKGFWVSCRIQPLVDIDDAEKLVIACNDKVDFITVEHLKIALDNKHIKNVLFELTGTNKDNYKSTGREYELPTFQKRENILRLKAVAKVPIGCGDNDLHELSDTNNCCGVDTMGEMFNGWMRYNAMYINKTGDESQWCPTGNCSSCVNNTCRKQGFGVKEYVDDYRKTNQSTPKDFLISILLDDEQSEQWLKKHLSDAYDRKQCLEAVLHSFENKTVLKIVKDNKLEDKLKTLKDQLIETLKHEA